MRYIHVTLLLEKRDFMFDKMVWIGEISCGGSLLAAKALFLYCDVL